MKVFQNIKSNLTASSDPYAEYGITPGSEGGRNKRSNNKRSNKKRSNNKRSNNKRSNSKKRNRRNAKKTLTRKNSSYKL